MPKITTFQYYNRTNKLKLNVEVRFGSRGNNNLNEKFHFKTPDALKSITNTEIYYDKSLDNLREKFEGLCRKYESAKLEVSQVIIISLTARRGRNSNEFFPEAYSDGLPELPKKFYDYSNDTFSGSMEINFEYKVCEKQITELDKETLIVYYELYYNDGKMDIQVPQGYETPLKSVVGCTYHEYDKNENDIELPYSDELLTFLKNVNMGFNDLINKLAQYMGTEKKLIQSVNDNQKILTA